MRPLEHPRTTRMNTIQQDLKWSNSHGSESSTLETDEADDLYRSSMQSEDHRRTALQYPLVHWTLCRCQQYGAFSMRALARYQIILLGEQRHNRCEQLAQGCCPNNAAVGVEPATSWSRVQRPTATPPSHWCLCLALHTPSGTCQKWWQWQWQPAAVAWCSRRRNHTRTTKANALEVGRLCSALYKFIFLLLTYLITSEGDEEVGQYNLATGSSQTTSTTWDCWIGALTACSRHNNNCIYRVHQ